MGRPKVSIQPCEVRLLKAKHAGQYFYDKRERRIYVLANIPGGFVLIDIASGQRFGNDGSMDLMNKHLNEELDRFIEVDAENIHIEAKV